MTGWYVAPTLDVLLREVDASAPDRAKVADGGIGDPSHGSRNSDHNPAPSGCVHARDFTHDPNGGFDSYAFADWVRDRVNGHGMHISYVISNGRIYNPAVSPDWRRYGGANPHSHHVHVSIKYDHRENDTSPWGWYGGTADEDDDMTPEQAQALNEIHWLVSQVKPQTDRLTDMNSTLDSVSWGLLDPDVGNRVMTAKILDIVDDGK